MVQVSVVVPARNEQARLEACLDSLLRQDYPNGYEVIVVDDHSTDGTAAVAARFGVTVLQLADDSAGGAAARNAGVEHARGNVVAFTDADCRPAQDWLRHLLVPFQDPGVGVCGGEVVGRGGSIVARYVEAAGIFRLESRMRAQPWPILVTANVAYRKTVFQVLGLFDASLGGAADMEMSWRVAQDGCFRVVACPTAVVSHLHPSTVGGLYQQWYSYGAGRARLVASLQHRGGLVREGLRQSCLALVSCALALLRAAWRFVRQPKKGGGQLVFPFLDAVRAVAFAAGYWQGARGRMPSGSWRERAAGMAPKPAKAACKPQGRG